MDCSLRLTTAGLEIRDQSDAKSTRRADVEGRRNRRRAAVNRDRITGELATAAGIQIEVLLVKDIVDVEAHCRFLQPGSGREGITGAGIEHRVAAQAVVVDQSGVTLAGVF